MKDLARPDSFGRYGQFGGKYVPETLMAALDNLEKVYNETVQDPAFQRSSPGGVPVDSQGLRGSQSPSPHSNVSQQHRPSVPFQAEFQSILKDHAEFQSILKDYVGRESPLYFAERLTEHYSRPDPADPSRRVGPHVYLKREDLNHTGAHKINNAIGQVLLAKRIGKKRIIAETGAGQHGVATATVCARFGLNCIVYMGAEDMRRQALNVFRMRLLGAEVRAVHSGTRTLKDATSEAIRDWVTNVDTTHYILGSAAGPHPYPMIVRDFQLPLPTPTPRLSSFRPSQNPDWATNLDTTHYILGSAAGPHPYPMIVRDFQVPSLTLLLPTPTFPPSLLLITSTLPAYAPSLPTCPPTLLAYPPTLPACPPTKIVSRSLLHLPACQAIIGREAKKQSYEKFNRLPDVLVACVGGGSNAMGLFHEFVEDEGVRMVGVEAAGHGVHTDKHAATLTAGEVGVLHGAMSYLLQDSDGQIIEPHSIMLPLNPQSSPHLFSASFCSLDYPGVGPEHSFLKDIGRAEYFSVTDDEALQAFKRVSRLEGIIPALETSHALAYLEYLCPQLADGTKVIVCFSGRGDKDVNTVIDLLGDDL
ncbi:unnamed protein product [Closterium sp. NIES-54]